MIDGICVNSFKFHLAIDVRESARNDGPRNSVGQSL